MPFTGNLLGKKILKEQQIYDVTIEPIKQLDHYNQLKKDSYW